MNIYSNPYTLPCSSPHDLRPRRPDPRADLPNLHPGGPAPEPGHAHLLRPPASQADPELHPLLLDLRGGHHGDPLPPPHDPQLPGPPGAAPLPQPPLLLGLGRGLEHRHAAQRLHHRGAVCHPHGGRGVPALQALQTPPSVPSGGVPAPHGDPGHGALLVRQWLPVRRGRGDLLRQQVVGVRIRVLPVRGGAGVPPAPAGGVSRLHRLHRLHLQVT